MAADLPKNVGCSGMKIGAAVSIRELLTDVFPDVRAEVTAPVAVDILSDEVSVAWLPSDIETTETETAGDTTVDVVENETDEMLDIVVDITFIEPVVLSKEEKLLRKRAHDAEVKRRKRALARAEREAALGPVVVLSKEEKLLRKRAHDAEVKRRKRALARAEREAMVA